MDTVFAPMPVKTTSWADPYTAMVVRDNCVLRSIEAMDRYREHVETLTEIIQRLRGERQ